MFSQKLRRRGGARPSAALGPRRRSRPVEQSGMRGSHGKSLTCPRQGIRAVYRAAPADGRHAFRKVTPNEPGLLRSCPRLARKLPKSCPRGRDLDKFGQNWPNVGRCCQTSANFGWQFLTQHWSVVGGQCWQNSAKCPNYTKSQPMLDRGGGEKGGPMVPPAENNGGTAAMLRARPAPPAKETHSSPRSRAGSFRTRSMHTRTAISSPRARPQRRSPTNAWPLPPRPARAGAGPPPDAHEERSERLLQRKREQTARRIERGGGCCRRVYHRRHELPDLDEYIVCV